MQKVFQAMSAGSKRGAVINWRVKLVGVPLTKKQLVARSVTLVCKCCK